MLPPAADDLEARRPVWQALSDLFLDTDASLSRAARVRELARSRYAVAEIEAILADEVYPVCRANLLSVAGEWAGFDLDWLQREILRRQAAPARGLRWPAFGRLAIRLSSEWRATKRDLIKARAAAGVAR